MLSRGNPQSPPFLLRRRYTQPFLSSHGSDVLVAHAKFGPANQSSNLISSQLRMFAAQVHHGLVDPLLLAAWELGLIPITGTVETKKPANLTLPTTALPSRLPSQVSSVSNA